MATFFGGIVAAAVILSSHTAFAQTSRELLAKSSNGPNARAVDAWYTAWEKNDWNSMRQLLADVIAAIALSPVKMSGNVGNTMVSIGPTAENALAADQELARALQNNDSVGIYRMLDKDWAVITTNGDVGEGAGLFPAGIRSGYRTLTVMELLEPRVRLYGNVAVVTTKVRIAGTFAGKSFDIKERQTDVLRWEKGKWKCILTHETKLKE